MFTKRRLVENQGQVKSMQLPEGWFEREVEETTSHTFMRQFQAADNEEVTLSFYYRGHRTSDGDATNFLRVLGQPDHELSSEEAKSVRSIIRNASDADWFLTNSIRTENLKGKCVLMLEGIWKASDLADLGVFVDSDGTGSAVQEIHFTAPKDEYSKYLAMIEEALKSVKWK